MTINNKIKNGLALSLCLILSACSLQAHNKTELLSASLDNWQNVYNDGEAKLNQGEIELISKSNWFYLTKKKYSDFVLEAEIKMPDPATITEYNNSGFIVRAQVRDSKKSGQEAYGYQAEVDPSKRKWSGGLYDQGRRQWLNPLHEKRSKPDSDFKENLSPKWTDEKANAYKANQWNKYKIVCLGSDIKIYVNDVLTTHVIDTKDKTGYIGIQHHGSKKYQETGDSANSIFFRNITVTEL
ncbi:MAG: 3-keto-disaccharide hydrolase [Thalassotalea sp.]